MKIYTGEVISKKMEKTATVSVARIEVHKTYKKRVKRTKKYQVHDELETEVGQKVRFVESKPYSKTKKWKIVEVLSKDIKKAERKKESKMSVKKK
jgi:small subunit ribosomal protein S17